MAVALLSLSVACGDDDSPPAEAHEADELSPYTEWPDVINAALAGAYGDSGSSGRARVPGHLPELVHRIDRRTHVVYVTSGAFRTQRPHELVLRVRTSAPFDGPRPSSEWAEAILTHIAREEADRGRLFGPGDLLRNVQVDGVPYRYFTFLEDPVLTEQSLDARTEKLVFIQVLPLTDAEADSFDASSASADDLLRAWAARDRLYRVDASPTAE